MRQFKPDDATEILDHGFSIVGKADAVFMDIDGYHGRFRNRSSAKTYLVTQGSITVEVEGKETRVGEREVLTVPIGRAHSLQGHAARAVVICCPPFDPVQEDAA